jgi:hypothetical protein
MTKDVDVGIEEGDGTAVGQARSFQEVAGTGTDIEVSVADVPPIALHKVSGRAPPHCGREDAKDQGVVDPEEQRRVLALACVGGVVALHRAHALLHHAGSEMGLPKMNSASTRVKSVGATHLPLGHLIAPPRA